MPPIKAEKAAGQPTTPGSSLDEVTLSRIAIEAGKPSTTGGIRRRIGNTALTNPETDSLTGSGHYPHIVEMHGLDNLVGDC